MLRSKTGSRRGVKVEDNSGEGVWLVGGNLQRSRRRGFATLAWLMGAGADESTGSWLMMLN